MKRVIVTHFGAIGDQVLSTPALLGLKRRFGHLTLLAPPAAAELMENLDLFDKFIPFTPSQEKDRLLKLLDETGQRLYMEKLLALEAKEQEYLLAQNGDVTYDHNLNFHGVMVGPIVYRQGSPGFQRVSDDPEAGSRQNREEHRHSNYIDQFLTRAEVMDLVAPWERRPRFMLSPEERQRVKRWRKRNGIKPSDIVLMWHFAGSGPNKIYPHFGRVAVELLQRHKKLRLVLSGDKASRKTAERVFDLWPKLKTESRLLPRVISNCGKYGLRDAAVLIDACDIFIGPDTGFFHIAQALEKRQVLIIAHTEPHVAAKYYRDCIPVMANFPCAPCHRIIDSPRCPEFASGRPTLRRGVVVNERKIEAPPCLQSIDPARVIAAAERHIEAILLSRRGNPPVGAHNPVGAGSPRPNREGTNNHSPETVEARHAVPEIHRRRMACARNS